MPPGHPVLSPGQHGDCPQFIPLMEQIRIARRGKGRPRTRPGRAMAGKAYSSAASRAYLRRRGIKAVIPVKEDQKNHRRARGRSGLATRSRSMIYGTRPRPKAVTSGLDCRAAGCEQATDTAGETGYTTCQRGDQPGLPAGRTTLRTLNHTPSVATRPRRERRRVKGRRARPASEVIGMRLVPRDKPPATFYG